MDTDDAKANYVCGKPASELALCYMVCMKDAAGAYVGAIMLADHRARPQHFAYVHPVKPTKMQKILYGSSLEEHLRIDVIGQKLLQQLPKKPDIIFVESNDLINIRRLARVPTAFLAKREETDSNSLSALQFESIPDDQQLVGEVVVRLEVSLNLTEPFLRIRQALQEALKASEKA